MRKDTLANKLRSELINKAYEQGYQDAIKDMEKKQNRRAE